MNIFITILYPESTGFWATLYNEYWEIIELVRKNLIFLKVLINRYVYFVAHLSYIGQQI